MKYRAIAALFVDGRPIAPDEEFASASVPGRNWEPIDKEAKAAVSAHFASVPEQSAFAKSVLAEPAILGGTEIPVDWRGLHHMTRIKIARALAGAIEVPDGKTETQVADEIIAAEMENRAAEEG